MNENIEKLIASGKEGPWWDFKQTYHQNNAALVHDILCMANVMHDGDRYLIFGVTDEGLITGVPEDDKQLNQANLIDLSSCHSWYLRTQWKKKKSSSLFKVSLLIFVRTACLIQPQ